MLRNVLVLAASALGFTSGAFAQDAARVTPMTPDVVPSYEQTLPSADFIRREAMVPMRDGTKLYTTIVMKKGTSNGPILLSRTPYDAHESTHRVASQRIVDILEAMDAEFALDGYIRVYQDIRGLHRSEGQYVMNRPIVGPLNDTGIDESTDAYDTIDWLVKNVPESNKHVGVIGSSYLGFTTLMAEINPHPALKAAVPESPMVDGWMGDDWFHNGAFRVSSLDYAVEQATNKAQSGAGTFALGSGDSYTRYLEAGSVADFAKLLGIGHYPGVRKFIENPAYTEFWSLQAVDKWLAARPLTVPTMLEVGQWDQEDSYGAPAVYRAQQFAGKHNPLVKLVIGPWRHSGANHGGHDLGALIFTGDTAREWRVRYLKPFLDQWLKGGPDAHTPPVLTYATGIGQWQESPRWPMGVGKPLYLAAGGAASFERPAAAGHDDYVSDPAHPVPFIPRPIDMGDATQWKPWLVHDQRFVSDRPDVAVWQTTPLDQPVHLMGAPEVDLHAATSGTDSDWVVKLIDVYPNDVPEPAAQGGKPSMAGYELPIGIEIFRGRYWKSYAQPAELEPGRVERYRWALPNVNHVFLPGHRIMVQVQSSLFPLYDRNPQTFVDNIMLARPTDYRPATQSIWHGGATASAGGAAGGAARCPLTGLIVTLRMEAGAAARFTALRKAHFPAHRNWLAAHITLFHALPVESVDTVLGDVAAVAALSPVFQMHLDRVLFLGQGVAYGLSSREGVQLRQALAARWDTLLGRQDRAWPGRLHVTVQNKVDPAAARALYDELSNRFTPENVGANGLDVWHYAGGPWRPAAAFNFTD